MSEPEVLKNIRIVHDVLILKKSHKLIRRMQRALAQPEIHGYQVWGSSFLIMDYLLQHPPRRGSKVMEIGCGWGILGIFCAQQFKSKVTAIDADEHVFPYLDAHALLNDVSITQRVARYEELAGIQLGETRLATLLGEELLAKDAGTGRIYATSRGRRVLNAVIAYLCGD